MSPDRSWDSSGRHWRTVEIASVIIIKYHSLIVATLNSLFCVMSYIQSRSSSCVVSQTERGSSHRSSIRSVFEKVTLPITALLACRMITLFTTAVFYTRMHSQPVTVIAMYQYRFVMWAFYLYYHNAFGSK